MTYMMPIDTVLHFAFLTTSARIEPSEERDGYYLIGRRLVLVLEAALGSFRARSSQVMVIAEFVIVFPHLDPLQRRL